MQINSLSNSYGSILSQEQLSPSPTQSLREEKTDEQEIHTQEKQDYKQARITYGLQILELMSNEEYQAFLRASEGLNENEKIAMAQHLYRFTNFYQGRKEIESSYLDATLQDKYKAFGIDKNNTERNVARYINALNEIQSKNHLQ
ncbi:MAG: hypothetical protein PUJ79_07040 [Helicobacter sp.]|nr:hypothetical protein [Helicobacter sp.]MDY5740972.1 hypothetical protein [Helicobacter sp.]